MHSDSVPLHVACYFALEVSKVVSSSQMWWDSPLLCFGVGLFYSLCSNSQDHFKVEAHLLFLFLFLFLEILLIGCCIDSSVFLVFVPSS